MCYSAMVKQKCKTLGLDFEARVDLNLMEDIFDRRLRGESIIIPKGLEHCFLNPQSDLEKSIKSKIDSFHEEQIQTLQKELFTLRKRLVTAEQKLKEKPTKSAEKEKGVAERQIERKRLRLENISRTQYASTDDRIYPFNWTPVIVERNGERVVVPMRYHLRPPGTPPPFDNERPGCYNARRDNLTKFWRKEFGRKHGIIVLTSFFENVSRHTYEKRELKAGEKPENLILQFIPQGVEQMIVPIIWDTWTGEGESTFDSFAIVTDDPPFEISDAGHDRCPVFIKHENIASWLNPSGRSDAELFAILDDRIRPNYQHEIAA